MKRLWIWMLIGFLISSSVLQVHAEDESKIETEMETEAPPEIHPDDEVTTEDIVLYSEGIVVMDMDTGAVLYGKNMDRRLYPASITKILTGYLACEYLNLEDKIEFTEAAVNGIDIWLDMNIGMEAGEILTVDQALHALMMVSANEVACGLGIAVSGSLPAFADLMNETAAELGCKNSHFVNPNGLHSDEHYTTAYDMAKIAAAAYGNEAFRTLIQTPSYVIEKTNLKEEPIELIQQHKMYVESDYTYEGCLGGKTGFTSEAESTLVTYAQKNGMRLVCVTMKAENWHHYTDTIQALDYCFANYGRVPAGKESRIGQELNEAYCERMSVWKPDIQGKERHFWVDENQRISCRADGMDNLTETFAPSGWLTIPAAPYDGYVRLCGYLYYYDGPRYMGRVPVYETLPKLAFGEKLPLVDVISGVLLGETPSEPGAKPETWRVESELEDQQQGFVGRLRSVEIQRIWLVIGAVGILVGMLILIGILRARARRRRRKNYEQMRRRRLEEKEHPEES